MADRSEDGSLDTGRVFVRLFGHFSVEPPDQTIALPGSRKASALLAHLVAAEGERVSRETLASLLWSDRGEEQARASLRQALYDLREFSSGATPLLVVDRTHARADPRRFSTDLSEIRSAASDPVRFAALIGDKLPDFLAGYDGLSAGFDEWLRPERARRQDERRALALDAGRAALSSGEIASRLATALLSADPLDEGAAQLAMEVHRARGDYDGVRRIFARLETALRTELGVAPSSATRALLDAPIDTTDRPAIVPPASGPNDIAPKPATTSRIARRTVLTGAAAVAGLAAGVGGWSLWRPTDQASDLNIAVLPFENLSGDPKRAYFVEGITEEIRTALNAIQKVRIIGRVSSTAMRDMDPKEMASRFGIGSILTGSVRQSTSTVRVGAQLVDALTGEQRWSDTYDRSLGDILPLESDIAKGVAAALNARLGTYETFIGTTDARAHDLYLQANAISWGSDDPATFRKALALYDQAITLDPNYIKPYVDRAFAIWWLLSSTPDRAAQLRMMDDAERSARRAIQIAPQSPLGYRTLGMIRETRLDVRGALALYRKADALDNGRGRASAAYLLASIGRKSEALAAISEATSRDPLDPYPWLTLAYVHYCAHRFDDVISLSDQVLKWAPKMSTFKQLSGAALLLLGRPKEALEKLSEISERLALPFNVMALDRVGEREKASAMLTDLIRDRSDTMSYQIAEIYAWRGESDKAIEALYIAERNADGGLLSIASDPFFPPLQRDRRFEALAAKFSVA